MIKIFLDIVLFKNEYTVFFSFSEKMKWAEELKKEYSKIAKGNQLSFGQHRPSEHIETSQKIAQELDIGQTTLKKAQYIYNNAPEEIIQQLDDEKLSSNKAYITLKEQLKSEKEKAKVLEQKLKQEQCKSPKVEIKKIEIDNTDYHKIDELQDRIKKYDNES